jgi:hypothetical protein
VRRGSRRKQKVLTLRDRKGQIRAVARTESEQKDLRRYWNKHYGKQRLEVAVAGSRLKELVRKLKQEARDRGFTYQMSVWGMTTNTRTGEKNYRRYEIFKAEKWRGDEWAAVKDLLRDHPLKTRAGVFIYDSNKLYAFPEDGLA